MGEKDRIEVLMKEYDTLRAEILVRVQSRFALASILGGAATIAIATEAGGERHWLLGGLVALGAILLWVWLGRLIVIAHKGLVRLEHAVNGIAGETLLRWEHDRPTARWHEWR